MSLIDVYKVAHSHIRTACFIMVSTNNLSCEMNTTTLILRNVKSLHIRVYCVVIYSDIQLI